MFRAKIHNLFFSMVVLGIFVLKKKPFGFGNWLPQIYGSIRREFVRKKPIGYLAEKIFEVRHNN